MRTPNGRLIILSALFGSVSKVPIERMVRYSRTPQLWTMLPTSCEKPSVAVAIDEPSVRYWSEVVNEFAEIEVASSRLPVNAAQKPNAHLTLSRCSVASRFTARVFSCVSVNCLRNVPKNMLAHSPAGARVGDCKPDGRVCIGRSWL